MTNTFKYLDNTKKQQSSEDAAQMFLNEKLSKNKYTKQQQNTFDANRGPTVANATAKLGVKYEAEAPSASGSGIKSSKTATSTWDGENYSQGAFNADDLKKHFGLQDGTAKAGYNAAAGATDSDKAKDNDLLGKGYLSNEKYESLKNDSKIKDAYAALHGQSAADKKFKDGSISINTMDALFDDLTARANREPEPEPVAEPRKKQTPIEHSPEIKQAKERVNSYENDILSGKTSEDIYGSGADYSFDAAKGAAGIGTPMNGDSGQQASKATASFLDNKKSQVKDKYQFQAQV